MIAATLAVVISISAMVFAGMQGANQTKPHRPVPSAQSTQQANHAKHGHAPFWLFRATDWVVLVASKGLT